MMHTAIQWLNRLSPRTLTGKRNLIGYIFVSPSILGFLLWFLGPLLVALWLAFTDWNMLTPARWVGLDNFRQALFRDKLFWQSLKVTTTYSLVSVPTGLVLSFLIALLMNAKIRGISFFRTVYYLPTIVPTVASAVLWAWVLNTEFGLLNTFLHFIGLPKIRWLQDPQWALPALILMSLWGLGGGMVIYLAGLQGIPDVLYEAAEIDGATRWDKFRLVTIPLMSPVLFFNLVMGIIGSFQVFAAGFLVTGGGPQNATLFYVLHLYRSAFRYLDMGYAAALSWVLFFIILTLTAIVFKYAGSLVYYEQAE